MGGDSGPSREADGRILVCKRARRVAMTRGARRGEHKIEDMDSSGAAGDFDCGARCAAGDVDVLRAATGGAGDAYAGATAGRGAEAADGAAAAFASGETASASAAGG